MTALAARDMKVSLLVRSKAIFSQLADPYTASLAEKVLRSHGIRTIKDIEVSGIASRSRSDQPATPLVVHTWPMPRGRALECLRRSRHTELVDKHPARLLGMGGSRGSWREPLRRHTWTQASPRPPQPLPNGEDALNIEVRLFASLRRYLPSSASGTSAHMDMPAGATIADVFEKLGIPAGAARLVLVNGSQESNTDRQLEDGCTLSVFPPVAGG